MHILILVIFFFNDTATTEIYTLSLHDALPISPHPHGALLLADYLLGPEGQAVLEKFEYGSAAKNLGFKRWRPDRSEEHTSELQSRQYLVCRLLLEKKKKK